MDFVDALIPISVSCVMPVAIVGFIAWANTKKSAHKMNAVVKAIESGAEIDPNVLLAIKSKGRTTRMELVNKLGGGVVLTLMGLMFTLSAAFGLSSFPSWGYYPGFPLLAAGIGTLVSFFFGMKYLKKDMEKEDGR